MTPDEPTQFDTVRNELTYASYVHHRMRFPDEDPARLELVFGAASEEMEARYQSEKPALDRELAGIVTPVRGGGR